MWGPDPAKPGPSSASGGLWISPEELSAADAPSGPESDLAELAAKFSAHSGGGLSQELSTDLALEIVLNEIVEQACLATGATGAAIVLERDGELVCRASAGSTAPDLGVRLGSETGLSGACVKTRETQRCDDAQSDSRTDREACRMLGVRSVMILPLLRNNDLAGVFEVFSSRPSAFGERDERTLEALAQRALKNLQRASEPLLVSVPVPDSSSTVTQPDIVTRPEERLLMEWESRKNEVESVYPADVAPTNGRSQFDGVTLALAAVVFACAVLLSTLVGLHFGRQRAASTHGHAAKARIGTAVGAQHQNALPSNPIASSAPAEVAATPATGTSALGGQAPAVPGSRQPGSRAAVTPPAGSLLIYENGKEVFRMLPSESSVKKNGNGGQVERASSVEAAPALELSSDAAESSLLHRVEPDYPEAARRQGIQGQVVLDLRIGKDGAVQDVGLVSGQPVLADAATSAVKQWLFKPHYVDGREVEMQTRITLRFSLPPQ